MAYQNIPFLRTGKQALKKEYRKWFSFDTNICYESGDIEAHFKGRQHDLPNGNARRWDYVIIKLDNDNLVRVVFAEPHPIHEGNVTEMLEKLEWLKQTMTTDANLRHFNPNTSEFYWIYSHNRISKNSNSRRKLDSKKLKLATNPLAI